MKEFYKCSTLDKFYVNDTRKNELISSNYLDKTTLYDYLSHRTAEMDTQSYSQMERGAGLGQ